MATLFRAEVISPGYSAWSEYMCSAISLTVEMYGPGNQKEGKKKSESTINMTSGDILANFCLSLP